MVSPDLCDEKVTPQDDIHAQTAQECAHVAKVMAWYNGKLSAKKLVDGYKEYIRRIEQSQTKLREEERTKSKYDPDSTEQNSKNDVDEKEKITKAENEHTTEKEKILFQDLAELIDIVLEKLKNLNAIFVEAKNAESYKDYLSTEIGGFTSPYTPKNNKECYKFTGKKLWQKLGREVQKVFDYMWSFLDVGPIFTEYENLSPIQKVVKEQYEFIQDAAILQGKYSEIPTILDLENAIIVSEIIAHKILINDDKFYYQDWNVEKKDDNQGVSSYKFVFA